jgi:hypothetical protein
MKKYFYIQCIILFPLWSFSQETKLPQVITIIAEELAADDSDPDAAVTYIEWLSELAENPVMLNSANEDEISRLFFLSEFQVKALADYAHSSGNIISVYEILNIPGFDKETTEMMKPFIILENKYSFNPDSVKWKNMSITNISIKPGNVDTTSLGSQWKILSKYRFSAGRFSGGLTCEKDPGESLFYNDPPFTDFLSAHLAWNGKGILRRLIIGDYSARFGLGTNINNGIRTAFSLTAPGYVSAREEIKPYTSSDENSFFRGVATEFAINNLAVSLLYSKNYIDATLNSSSGLAEDYIENFYLTGSHNTPSSLLKKDAASDLTYGINLSYDIKNLRIGLVWSENKFSLPVNSSGNNIEDVFDFKGYKNQSYSINYRSLIKKIMLYGEFSTNGNNKYAFVQGMSIRPSDRLNILFLFRNYGAGYFAFHGKGPGSSSRTGNEQGIMGNFTFEAAKHLFIGAGYDISKYPWLKYRCSAPSMEKRQEVRLKYLPSERLILEVLYSLRNSEFDKITTVGVPDQVELISRTFKGSVKYMIKENLSLMIRFDQKYIDPTGSMGMLLLEDVNYRFSSLPLTIWLRYCIFNTDDWDSRLYTYENDLLYSFSIPALSGTGTRSYIMVKWEIGELAEFRFRYGITELSKRGTTTEDKNEIKIQFRVWF